jgi:hypothetical protein
MKIVSHKELLALPSDTVFSAASRGSDSSSSLYLKGDSYDDTYFTYRELSSITIDARMDSPDLGDIFVVWDHDQLESIGRKIYHAKQNARQLVKMTQPLGTKEEKKTVHDVIDWVEDTAILDVMGGSMEMNYVHFMLDHFTRPAWVKMAHNPWMNTYALFVDYDGKTYKVTGASTMGDVFLAKDLKRQNGSGYDKRVMLDFAKLTYWRGVSHE